MAVVQNGLLYSADPADSTIGDLFVIVNQDENVTVAGSAGPDIVEVSNYKEAITGYNISTADGGDNIDLQAGGTNDLVASNTFVNTNAGNDSLIFDSLLGSTIYAGAGTDRINPSGNFFGTALVSSLIRLNDGDDFFNRTAGGVTQNANIEGSTINGNAGIDELWFGDNAQLPAPTGGYLTNNVIHGGADQDTININIRQADVFRGNTINGNLANDVIIVTALRNNANTNISDNTVFGGQGTDTINAGASTGNLYLSGDNGNDTVVGGAGADTVMGGEGADSIEGGNGNDFINGNADNDIISGEGGDDNIFGGNGRDTIDAGTGRDTVTGNLGADSIALNDGTVITDTVVQNNGDSVNATAVNAGVFWAAGDTVTYGTGTAAGTVDLITGFDSNSAAEDQLVIQGTLNALGVPAGLIGEAVSGAGTAGNAYVVYGNYAAGVFTMQSNAWAAATDDALVVVGNNGALTINSNAFILTGLGAGLDAGNFA